MTIVFVQNFMSLNQQITERLLNLNKVLGIAVRVIIVNLLKDKRGDIAGT